MDLEALTSVILKVKASDLTKKVLALCRKVQLETLVNLKSRGYFEFVVQLEKLPSWKVRK